MRNSGASLACEVIGQIGNGLAASRRAVDCRRMAGLGLLPNSLLLPATVTTAPRGRSGFGTVEFVEFLFGPVEPPLEVLVVGSGQQTRLSAILLKEAGRLGVRNPDLHEPQPLLVHAVAMAGLIMGVSGGHRLHISAVGLVCQAIGFR